MKPELPIDAALPRIVEALRTRRAVVVVAPPGTGKSTRIPPALLADGPVVLLQPRRVAARALAARIAAEQGFTLGEEVGWQVRQERRFSARTRLLVATEGILTARLRSDPLLGSFRTIVLDELHERSLHTDLALALARQAWLARDDLRLAVLSATLDAASVAAYLGGCPVVEVAARTHPVEIEYAPDLTPFIAIRAALARAGEGVGGGHVLCFLPGAGEIRKVEMALQGAVPAGVRVLPLHGSLKADEQDRAIAPSRERKVVLATNVAETSVTVEGVTIVVDTGLEKVLRLDHSIGIDRLEVERVSAGSATQRAGRAGRTGPGRAVRLWDARDTLRAHREPEIRRVDLAAPFLAVLAWGGDPLRFEWLEPPPEDAARNAMALLEALGAVRAEGADQRDAAVRRITPLGLALADLPLPPRLGRVLLAAGGGPRAAAAVAVLAERDFFPRGPAPETTDSDVLARADRIATAPESVRRAAREIEALVRGAARSHGAGGASIDSDERILRALLDGFPDRVARRRAPGSDRFQLASGHGAVLARESGVREGDHVVAIDVTGGTRPGVDEAVIRIASQVDRSWIEPTAREVVHSLDASGRTVRAVERELCGAIVLAERPVPPDPEAAAALLARTAIERGFGEDGEQVLRRLRFAGLASDLDLESLVRAACAGRTTLPGALKLGELLPHDVRARLERAAPVSLVVPSGRTHRLDYRDDGDVVLEVKLQELFGLAESPRIGPERRPVVLSLLSPGGRPVQTTRDLRSFWDRTYPEVRRELRARYPKHPWPEDPWTATPTARTTRRPPRG